MGADTKCGRCSRERPCGCVLLMPEEHRALTGEVERLTAEVEMLRGVGCLEDGDGPCGACRKCARVERDEAKAEASALRRDLARVTAEVERLRGGGS